MNNAFIQQNLALELSFRYQYSPVYFVCLFMVCSRICVCVVGHTHVYLERLKIDLGVFPCPSSFAEARSLAKAFPSASQASQLALGICRLQAGHHTYLSGF